MIPRATADIVSEALTDEAAVVLLGPRQVGKTTLAIKIGESRPSIYLDLENRSDREKLADPVSYLAAYVDRLVILDEIQRVPTLFEELRGIIDAGRRTGKGTGRFLLLGSASIDLMKQSETLAGRIDYTELAPLSPVEIEEEDLQRLWLRGGFPRSFLASDDRASLRWRSNFIRTYLERDIPMFGPRVSAETLERFWTMLAHNQGALLNASDLARNLGVSAPTVSGYVDLLVDLLLVRRLTPLHANVGKRLVKSPKTFIRDSGLVHALLGIGDHDTLLGHPVVGASWEGFVIEALITHAPESTKAHFYRTARGAEVDLVLDMGPGIGRWAIEVKLGRLAKTSRGFFSAQQDLEPNRSFVVYGGTERFPKSETVEAIGVRELCQELAALR